MSTNIPSWLNEYASKSNETDLTGLFLIGEVVRFNYSLVKPYPPKKDQPVPPENAQDIVVSISIKAGGELYSYEQRVYWDNLEEKPILLKEGDRVCLAVHSASVGYRKLGEDGKGKNISVTEHIIKSASLADVDVVPSINKDKKVAKPAA